MKLKLIAAMSILGLISCPVFADDTQSTPDTPVKAKHHNHHKLVKHEPPPPPPPVDLKEEMPVEPAPVEVCTLSQGDFVMAMMTQNANRSLPNPCNPGWFNRLQMSGGVNVDMGKWGNRNANIMGVNYQAVSLNDAYLNIGAIVNDWTHAFVSLSYNTTTINEPLEFLDGPHVSEYSSAYNGTPISSSLLHGLQLEQAYFTIGNFDSYPLFFQVGKQFQDFNRYDIHPITRSMTQVMSETLAVSAKLGFISELGFNGSIYVFDNPIHRIDQTHYPINYGGALGFEQTICDWGWDLGVAYLYDLMGVNDIAFNVAQFNLIAGQGINYHSQKGGIAAYGDIHYGPFAVGVRWTAAVHQFNPLDLPRHGVYDVDADGFVRPGSIGAKPWSAGIVASYQFDGFWEYQQNIYLSYQTSRQSSGLQLPKHRFQAGVGIVPWPNTDFTLEWDREVAFNFVNGGSGKITNLVTIRADVRYG